MSFVFTHPYEFHPAYKKRVAYFCMESGIHQPFGFSEMELSYKSMKEIFYMANWLFATITGWLSGHIISTTSLLMEVLNWIWMFTTGVYQTGKNQHELIIAGDCIRITPECHTGTKNIIKQFVQWFSYQFIRAVFQLFTFYLIGSIRPVLVQFLPDQYHAFWWLASLDAPRFKQ